MSVDAAVTAYALLSAAEKQRRTEELHAVHVNAYNIFLASAEFRQGYKDAQKYLDAEFTEEKLTARATGQPLDLGYSRGGFLWLTKQFANAAKTELADKFARATLREKFIAAAANPVESVAWFAATNPALFNNIGTFAREHPGTNAPGKNAFYYIGFIARLAKSSSDATNLKVGAHVAGQKWPEEIFLRRALEQRGRQLSDILIKDARKNPTSLMARVSP